MKVGTLFLGVVECSPRFSSKIAIAMTVVQGEFASASEGHLEICKINMHKFGTATICKISSCIIILALTIGRGVHWLVHLVRHCCQGVSHHEQEGAGQ